MSNWKMADDIGYTPKTTFWEDFSFAENIGPESIKYEAEILFEKSKINTEELTELIMVINHKSWYWYDHRNVILSELYSSLYHEYDEKAYQFLQNNRGEKDLSYYFRTLD